MKNSGYSYPDRILKKDEGVSVAAFYTVHYTHSTGETWRQRIQAGQVLLNGRPALPDELLTRGDRLIYHRLPWEEPEAPTDFGTLFEDDDVLVLAKPSGLPVLPGGMFLENTLLHLVRQRLWLRVLAAPSARPRHLRGHSLHPQPPGRPAVDGRP